MTSLRERLKGLSVKTADGATFIPDYDLEDVISDAVINDVLSGDQFALNFYKRREVSQLIAEGGRKTFAILVLLGREEAIFEFVVSDQFQDLDSKLPLEKEKVVSILGDEGGEDFYRTQWKFLAPILRKDRSYRKFDHERILPFLDRKRLGAGGFGDIYKITLHPFQQRLVDLNDNRKAIAVLKVIRPSRSASIENEERISACLRSLKHSNIVELLASYDLAGVQNLIFPLAQGDLEALLLGTMQLPLNLQNSYEILREIYGLSSALEMVHKFFVDDYDLKMIGCHHDLKPKNVLIKDGKFLLADFGLSRLDLAEDFTERELKYFQGDYIAPECESLRDGFKKNPLGTPSDVWSFGCILAEVVTFLIGGSEGVEMFKQKRKTTIQIMLFGVPHTTSTFHSDGEANPGVEGWLTALEDSSQNIIEYGDVLKLVRKILQIDPSQRPRIDLVVDALFSFAHKALFRFCRDKLELLRSNIEDTSSNSNNVKLGRQRHRYEIWGRAAGLATEFTSIEGVRGAEILKTDRSLQSQVCNILRDIEDEIHFLLSWHARSLFPTYFRFRSLNDKLWSFLPHLRDEMDSAVESAMLDAKSSKELQIITDTFRSSDHTISDLARWKNIYIASTEGDYTEGDDMELRPPDYWGFKDFGMHYLAQHGISEEGSSTCPVLIERIPYRENSEHAVGSRVRKISRLFSIPIDAERSGLRVLRCRGYYKNDRKHQEELPWYEMVYEIPTLEPETVRQFIKTAVKRYQRPSLGDLFNLATQIARCVLEVHKVGLLHKSISSHNIIFFKDPSSGVPALGQPYLIGFNHSRKDAWHAFTTGIDRERAVDLQRYHHPQYIDQQHGYRPEYDFYSLGVILLEIGRWRPLSNMFYGKTFGTSNEIRQALLEECRQNLGNSMGDLYRGATESCLMSDFILGRSREEMRNDFEEKVMNRLARCKA